MRKSVVIIGGGISGLGAADALAKNGIPVTVLESKPRFGGRIFTLREGRWPIELGAEFIHGRNPNLIRLIRAARLATHAAPEGQFIARGGRLKKLDVWKRVGDVIDRIDPSKPDCPFAKFLAMQNPSEESRLLAKRFAEGFDAARAELISSHALLKAQEASDQMDGEWQGRMTRGYSALIRFLQRRSIRAGGRLIANARVTHVRWNSKGVEATWRYGRDTKKTRADAAIITLPLGVLKAGTVIFQPGLIPKEEAITKLQFGNVMKVILKFRRRWWPKSRTGIIQAIDEPLPTWWSDTRGPLLTGWAGGPEADALALLRAKRLESLSLEIVSRVFSVEMDFLQKQLVKSHCYRWDQDPDILGAYSYIPAWGLSLPTALATPIGKTLYFAGEATVADAQTGTVFGAYETGLRAAREVLEDFR